MESDIVIMVDEVYKKFRNYADKSNNLKDKLIHHDRNKFDEYWVLKGLSFSVKKGEAVGLIGCNGCGKSTTLKLLTKIIYPDKGKININGRVSSLLELGAGFHPDLSGYENIYLNSAVFGLTRREIDKRIDEIIRFSELRDYIHNPIRTYSSGMYMKLAFSVAINVDADILLIDEILGVGDVSFQKKCFEKLLEIKKSGTTIVIVSHSTNQIEKICDRSIWLENGSIKMQGQPIEVHNEYLDIMEDRRLVRKRKEIEEKKKEQEEREKKEREKKEKEDFKKKKEKWNSKKNILTEEEKKEEELQVQMLQEIEKEKQKQKEAENQAEEKRKKQLQIRDSFKIEEIPEEKVGIIFFKTEAQRLEVAVEEKNIELERLNSVIREKDKEICRLESVIKQKDKERELTLLENAEQIEILHKEISQRK